MSKRRKNKPRSLKWSEFIVLTKTSFKEFFDGGYSFIHGAALAYYAVLALVPILYLAITYFGKIVGQEKVIVIIGDVLKKNMGVADITSLTALMYQWNIGKGGTSVLQITGIIALIIIATTLLNSLRKSINIFFGIKQVRHVHFLLDVLLKRLLYFGLIAGFATVTIIIYFAQSIILSFGTDLLVHGGIAEKSFFFILEHLSVLIINFLIFTFVFKFVHDGKVRWKLAMTGGFFTALLLYFGQLLINYYLLNFFFAKGGIAASILAILTFIMYSSQIIFLGAKYMSVYARMIGYPILPR